MDGLSVIEEPAEQVAGKLAHLVADAERRDGPQDDASNYANERPY